VVAATTESGAGTHGLSLFVVESDVPGFEARRIETLGWRTSHTGELSLDGTPGELLGEEGRGFAQIMRCFVWERISMALAAVSAADRTLEQAIAYSREREAFGRPVPASRCGATGSPIWPPRSARPAR
jgi:acyl-CoA dehydrogenase